MLINYHPSSDAGNSS